MRRIKVKTNSPAEVQQSMHLQTIPPVPEDMAAIARAAFLKGNLYLQIRFASGIVSQLNPNNPLK